MVLFAGAESCRRPRGVVGCIRIVLGLETDSVAETIDFTPLARNGAVQEITRINLNTRFGGKDIESNAGSRAVERGGMSIGITRISVQYEIMVIAVSVAELEIIGIDVLSDRFGNRVKVKG